MKRPSDFESSESIFRIKRILEKGTSSYTRGPKSIDHTHTGVPSSAVSNNAYSLNSEAEFRHMAGEEEDDVVRRITTEEGDGEEHNLPTFGTSLNGHMSHSVVGVTHSGTKVTTSNSKGDSNVSMMH